ncbi:hypothetical protein LIER_24468 [Lithospermum erythrorhizon]|uniref:Uncharacterized protein n=1 Tax=Lithospermum erythrorhizon TaxID=34254 RepID=A0AAV3R152_LITER
MIQILVLLSDGAPISWKTIVIDDFNQCVVNILVPCESDHCPLDITLEEELIKEPNIILEEIWNQRYEESGLDVLHYNLRSMRSALRKLNIECYSHISSRVPEKKIEMEELNGKILNGCLHPAILVNLLM